MSTTLIEFFSAFRQMRNRVPPISAAAIFSDFDLFEVSAVHIPIGKFFDCIKRGW